VILFVLSISIKITNLKPVLRRTQTQKKQIPHCWGSGDREAQKNEFKMHLKQV
jgi:hypothetical protein